MNVNELREILEANYDDKTVDDIILGLSEPRYVTIRVNTLKTNTDYIKEVLLQNDILVEEVSWYKDALIILNKQEKDLENLEIYKDGLIYLQSLSSMLPPILLNPRPLENILDMTAAPGSKTTEIAALTDNKAMITAVEKNKIRAHRLKYNIDKLGVKKTVILNQDARLLNDNFKFDKILLDAPCSGSGTLRIVDGVIKDKFDIDLINKSKKVQEELLNKASKLVNVGGLIVYSTCSILKVENEEIINNFLKKHDFEMVPIVQEFRDLPMINRGVGYMSIKPNARYEGFFVVILKRIK